jgi:hypothetical protein
MAIQWHPLFAQLLRPLMEGYYDVEINMPVGDAPRNRYRSCKQWQNPRKKVRSFTSNPSWS